MDSPIYLTHHAIKRARERCGWTASAALRMARKAHACGISVADAPEEIRLYLEGRASAHNSADESRVYGQHIFIIEAGKCITILHMPKHCQPALRKLQRARRAA